MEVIKSASGPRDKNLFQGIKFRSDKINLLQTSVTNNINQIFSSILKQGRRNKQIAQRKVNKTNIIQTWLQMFG